MIRPVAAGLSAAASACLYMALASPANASEWGCEVLLCLSNPGSPTEYAQCVPPIHKLYRELAKGHSFPTCSGVGFSATRPVYDPYECPQDFKIQYSYSERGDSGRSQRVATCRAATLSTLNESECRSSHDAGEARGNWHMVDGQAVCGHYAVTTPKLRERPRFVTVTIDGVGKQTVWF